MAQAYVDELNRLVAEVSTSSARRERAFIEERLKVVKQELDDAAREFSRFASKNAAIDIKEQGRAMVEAAALVQGQVIAAQTELESLKQVYTNQNVRVRAVQARISELQNQLRKLGGADEAESGAATRTAGDSLYPSIRRLPLLGVTYADLYRRTKIAEVVFELLTQQYELARVQEAKEIATVKLLDRPVPPESKSFPPRLAIVLLGSSFAGLAGIAWVLMCERWTSLDARDPERILGSEVLSGLQEQWLSGARGFGRWIGDRRARWGKGKQSPMGRSSG
jgi:capsule polysaccharide export protein KpsE/RkpR